MPLVDEKDFQVSLAGLDLQHSIMNAAGTCRSIEEVEALASSPVSAIMVGSITYEPREGNKGNVFWTSPDGQFSINNNGLPNKGAEWYQKNLPEMVKIAHNSKKAIFASVVGFKPSEYGFLSKMAIETGVDAVELNLSCPNILIDGKQKRISCFDLEYIEEIILVTERWTGDEAMIGIKVSPYSDPWLIEGVTNVLNDYSLIKFVIACNTFPNALVFDEKGKPVITFGDGYGGLSGPALKPIALGQVKQLRALLSDRIDVIGCGGITTGKDVADFLTAGATAVQVGTAFLNSGVKVFDRILKEYVDIALEAM